VCQAHLLWDLSCDGVWLQHQLVHMDCMHQVLAANTAQHAPGEAARSHQGKEVARLGAIRQRQDHLRWAAVHTSAKRVLVCKCFVGEQPAVNQLARRSAIMPEKHDVTYLSVGVQGRKLQQGVQQGLEALAVIAHIRSQHPVIASTPAPGWQLRLTPGQLLDRSMGACTCSTTQQADGFCDRQSNSPTPAAPITGHLLDMSPHATSARLFTTASKQHFEHQTRRCQSGGMCARAMRTCSPSTGLAKFKATLYCRSSRHTGRSVSVTRAPCSARACAGDEHVAN
jgi:hypothetical protein